MSQLAPHEIDLGTQRLHDIEGSVENWRQQALPEIEADLLSSAQNQFTQPEKNGELTCNGTQQVWIKTIQWEVCVLFAEIRISRTLNKLHQVDEPVARGLRESKIAGAMWLLQQSPQL